MVTDDHIDLANRAVDAAETIVAAKDRLIDLQYIRIAQLEAIRSGNMWIAFGVGGMVGVLAGVWLS